MALKYILYNVHTLLTGESSINTQARSVATEIKVAARHVYLKYAKNCSNDSIQ